jgi:hypothetical protein
MVTQEHVDEAIAKVSEIHQHLARGEVYRGFRPAATAVTGIVGIAAAGLQPLVVVPGDLPAFLRFWVAVAVANILLHGIAILRNYAVDSDLARKRTVRVLMQFLPPLAAGALVTGAAAFAGGEFIRILPGTWALLFSLALFSARPFLPRRTGWVALFYFICGTLLISPAGQAFDSHGLAMGATFGIGQIGAAIVLHRDEERHA